MERDRIPVDGVPQKFVLLNGWQVLKSDHKFLKGGHLVEQGQTNSVVKNSSYFSNIVEKFKALLAWKIKTIVWFIGFVAAILSILKYFD